MNRSRQLLKSFARFAFSINGAAQSVNREISMSLFDELTVEYPLPDPGASVVKKWRTMTFPDPWLENYKITAAGRLLHERYRCEDQSDPQYPLGSLGRLAGCLSRIHEGWEDTNFHGILNFYGNKYTGDLMVISFEEGELGKDILHPDPAEWFEYNAKFTDGQLVSIERICK